MRVKSLYVCQSCGFSSPKWLGRCPGCEQWETMVEEFISARPSKAAAERAAVVPFRSVGETRLERIVTCNSEFDRVLGGGIVPGSLILLGGEPGVGKSTLLLQISELLSEKSLSVVYVAGEESPEQIRLRGERLGLQGKNLILAVDTCLERALESVAEASAGFLVIDSIQTVYTEGLDGIPGSIGQIRECAQMLLKFSKRSGVPVLLIGHITKDGALAGPKALEHIVDVVLYFEGDRHQNQKIIRAEKNRFGPANELGIFQMTGRGLECVENPSRLFLSQRSEDVPGSVVLCALQGTRPVLVELQALVSQTHFSTARRMANGVDPNRVSLLLAMLEKRVGLALMGTDVYVNVAGGLNLSEPAVDLPLVAAVASSFYDRHLPSDTVVIGEVGLAGEVRAVNQIHARVREAASLGFQRVVLPENNLPLPEPPKNVRLEGVDSVRKFLEAVGL